MLRSCPLGWLLVFEVNNLKINKKYLGIIYIIISAFCFALMNTFVKLSGDLPSIQKSFFRNFVAMIFAAILLIKSGQGFKFKKGNLGLLLARSIFGTLGILCNFYAIDHLVLSDASMLNKLSPFFAVICSYFVLKEKVKPFQALAVIVAFIGALFIIKPQSISASLPSFVGMLGGFGAGVAYTMVRKLSQKGERGPFIVFFFSAFSCVVTLPYLIVDYSPMTIAQLVILICAGIAAAGGQFSITAAYSYAPAREISVFDYTQIIFAALMGFIAFGDIPDKFSIIGYVIICSVSVAMFLYNRKEG